MPLNEVLGKVLLLAIPGSIGATLAVKQLGGQEDHKEREDTYLGELFLMAAGALFFVVLTSRPPMKWC